MSKFYSNTYEKFLFEKQEEYLNNWRNAVTEIERLSKENADLKMTIERERQLYKLQLEQTARKLTLKWVSFLFTLLILTMNTNELRNQLIEDLIDLSYKNKESVIISIIKLLPQNQLEEIRDSLERDIF